MKIIYLKNFLDRILNFIKKKIYDIFYDKYNIYF